MLLVKVKNILRRQTWKLRGSNTLIRKRRKRGIFNSHYLCNFSCHVSGGCLDFEINMNTVFDREREIRDAETRLLEKDVPRTADEYERLVRSSPNSSFVWIKYIAFMLSLADVEKARSIAERYWSGQNINLPIMPLG